MKNAKSSQVHSYLNATPKHMEDMFNFMQTEIDNAERVFNETGEIIKLAMETEEQYQARLKTYER